MKRVKNEMFNILALPSTNLVDLGQDGRLLVLTAVLKDALDNTAAVRMRGELQHLVVEGRHDKVQAVRWNTLDALLDDVVSVAVLHALPHVRLKLLHNLQL